MSEIIKNLSEEDYHSQKGEKTPLFSYSTAKTMIQKSPHHVWLNHSLLGGGSHKSTKAMDRGSIIHGLLLGGGSEIEVIKTDNFRTKVAQEAKTQAYEEGKIPILEKDMDEIHSSVIVIKDQIKDLAPYFFEPHESELSIRWEMDNGVKCQSRFDWAQPETGRLIDLKTTADSSPDKLERAMITFGYDIQEAMYLKAAEKTWPEMAGRFTWEFIFIETESPYMVSVVETDSQMSWLGEHKMNHASDKWAECLKSGKWPGYGRFTVSAPGWAVNREEEK